MRTLILSLSLLLTISCSVENRLMRHAKKDIVQLTSQEFHGRGYTHNGLAMAEDYLASKFRDIGLIPVYSNYKQPVTYPINIIETTDLKINNKTQTFGIDYLVGPNAESDSILSETFNIPNHLFDFSLQDGKETFRLLSLNKGKIPVIDFRNLNDSLKEQRFALSNYLDSEKTTYNFPAIIGIQDKLIHGVSSHQDNFNHLFLTELPPEGSEISLKIKANKVTDFVSHNLVGKVKGTQSDSAIFVIAHYDHLGQVNQTIFPGANDNASGVAMLLQLAKYFTKNPTDKDVYFYAMTGEEVGLKGAIEAAKNLPIPKEKIRFVVNLDILGTGDDGIRVVNSTIFTQAYELLEKINKKDNLLKQIKKRGSSCNSDHCPFHELQIPNFYIYTLGGVSHYHNPLDKEETLPLTKFYQVFVLLTQFIQNI